MHFFFKKKTKNKPTSKCGSIVHSLRQESLCRLHMFMSHQMLLTKGQGQGQQFVFFIRESDTLPDTGTLRSTCYTRKCKQIARNPGRSRHCIRSNQPYLERNTVVHIKWEESLSTESEGRQCADGCIARNGQVQVLGSKLAFPHFGN